MIKVTDLCDRIAHAVGAICCAPNSKQIHRFGSSFEKK